MVQRMRSLYGEAENLVLAQSVKLDASAVQNLKNLKNHGSSVHIGRKANVDSSVHKQQQIRSGSSRQQGMKAGRESPPCLFSFRSLYIGAAVRKCCFLGEDLPLQFIFPGSSLISLSRGMPLS